MMYDEEYGQMMIDDYEEKEVVFEPDDESVPLVTDEVYEVCEAGGGIIDPVDVDKIGQVAAEGGKLDKGSELAGRQALKIQYKLGNITKETYKKKLACLVD